MAFVSTVVFWLGMLLCIPAGGLLLEVLAGLRRSKSLPQSAEARAVVLIPAHDEAAVLARTLERLRQSDLRGCRSVVLADNCSDDTAEIARAAGFEVWERRNPELRGKPYALEWALERLREAPPEVVVFLDADCWFESGSPRSLAAQAHHAQRPVQCIYLMRGRGLGAFAFRLRNEARQRGLQALGAPVQLTGSGFAVPWACLERVPVPRGELVEDAVWGWRFAAAGVGALLASEVQVASEPPMAASAQRSQRRRWEHGMFTALLRHAPGLAKSALWPPRLPRLLHLLDLLVPPLSLLILLLGALLVLGRWTGGNAAAAPAAIGLGAVLSATLLGWLRYGREQLSLTALLMAPLSLVKKISFYLSLPFNRERGWVRTERAVPDTMVVAQASTATSTLPQIKLLDVPLHACTMASAIAHVLSASAAGRGGWVLTPNLDILRRLRNDADFARLCEGSTLRLADGMPLVWASRLQRTPLPERVAGSDLIGELSAAAAAQGLPIFLLGGNPGTADAAAAILRARHPDLQIAGTHCPPFGFEEQEAEGRAIRSALHDARPAIVFVALGSPKQEQLIRALRADHPKAWFLGIGISFSFVAGEVARAPRWMRAVGLEWLHRLVRDPKRLGRRYLLHGIPFGIRLLTVSAVRGLRRRAD